MLVLFDGDHDACVEVTGKLWRVGTLLLCEFRGWTYSDGRTELTTVWVETREVRTLYSQVRTLWFVATINFAFWVYALGGGSVGTELSGRPLTEARVLICPGPC